MGGAMGLSTPGWGCSLELGSEACYPVREATVSALLEASASVASVAGIIGVQWLIDAGSAAAVLPIMAMCCFAGCIALAGFSGRLRRHEAEQQSGVADVDEDDDLIEADASSAVSSGRPLPELEAL